MIDQGLTFAQLAAASSNREIEWGTEGSTLEFRTIEMAGEAGELCNQIKKYIRAREGFVGGVPNLEPVADELADVVITCQLLASKLGINLGLSVIRKFDKTSDKHGFKTKLETPS